jgi:hypothetical protein
MLGLVWQLKMTLRAMMLWQEWQLTMSLRAQTGWLESAHVGRYCGAAWCRKKWRRAPEISTAGVLLWQVICKS